MKQTTILIADDHTILRQGLRILINSEPGLRCIGEAGSGEEAIALAREHTPDVVIMDISMEGLNGIDATRIIKNEHPDIKVVILSMFPDDEYVLGAVDAGASGYLVKQTAANNLIDAIQAVSNDQVYFSPAVSKVMVDAYRQQTATTGSSEVPDKLTRRERQILHLVAAGHTSRKIAEKLHLAPSTVETHRANIMAKLNIHDVASLVRYALKNNI